MHKSRESELWIKIYNQTYIFFFYQKWTKRGRWIFISFLLQLHVSLHVGGATVLVNVATGGFKKSFILIQIQVDLALTDSLPLSCMPFARRDSVFDLLSISSMIPWMWSPEIPWKSMAPGPGRNVQLPASVLQPTTSIYCTVLQRCAPLSQRIQMGSEALREAQKTTQPQKRFRSPPRHSAKATGRKERKTRRNYNMGGTGGMVVVVVVHQLFPSSVNVSPPGKNI